MRTPHDRNDKLYLSLYAQNITTRISVGFSSVWLKAATDWTRPRTRTRQSLFSANATWNIQWHLAHKQWFCRVRRPELDTRAVYRAIRAISIGIMISQISVILPMHNKVYGLALSLNRWVEDHVRKCLSLKGRAKSQYDCSLAYTNKQFAFCETFQKNLWTVAVQ
jgi:hypothetical protein